MIGHRGCVVAAASGNRTGALYIASPFAPHPPSAPSPRTRGEGNIRAEKDLLRWSSQCVPFSPRGGEKVPEAPAPYLIRGRMRGGRDGRARGMRRRGRLWQQYGCVVRRHSARPSPAFGTVSPLHGERGAVAGFRRTVETRTAPCGAVPCHVVGFYFAGAAAGAPAFLAKSPARNTLSASGFRCLRIAAFTWSTVSAAYFASRSAVNCMVRP